MVDNISFEDEVTSTTRSHNFVPSIAGAGLTENSTASNSNFTKLFTNNNPPESDTCQRQASSAQNERVIIASNATNRRYESSIGEYGSYGSSSKLREREPTSYLTRSVTQPNLGSKTGIAPLHSVATSNAQSEESVVRLQHNPFESRRLFPETSTSSYSSSYEDGLSGSLCSEYYDARSSFSAPVELLSEFLSALMSRDYGNALNLCLSILKYEPQNATAREFYPLLLTKIKQNRDGHTSTSEEDEDTDGDSDALEACDVDDDDDDDKQKVKEEKESSSARALTNDKRQQSFEKTHVNKPERPSFKKRSSEGGVVNKPKPSKKSPSICLSIDNITPSTSMDFSVEIDSGRESLFTPSDSDVNLESGDSLYSSTDSNLNMIRSGSDSLFSSQDTGLTLESAIKSMGKLGIDANQQAVK